MHCGEKESLLSSTLVIKIDTVIKNERKRNREREREREREVCHHTWEIVLGREELDREFACMFLIICFRLYLYLCMCDFLMEISTVILQGRSHTPILSLQRWKIWNGNESLGRHLLYYSIVRNCFETSIRRLHKFVVLNNRWLMNIIIGGY